MIHNLLPTQARLFHLKMKNTLHANCLLCDLSEQGDLPHSLLTCPFNTEVYKWPMRILQNHIPHLQPQQVVLLHLGPLDESLHLPIVWLFTNTLSLIWDDRIEKKKPGLHKIRSSLEAKVNILRKSRYKEAAEYIQSLEGFSTS